MQLKQVVPRRSARYLYKYVWIGVGIWSLFLATFAVAYARVSQHEKFPNTPFKSLSAQDTQKPADSY